MPFDYSPTVLLVEDEPHIRRFVRESLQAEGCTVQPSACSDSRTKRRIWGSSSTSRTVGE